MIDYERDPLDRPVERKNALFHASWRNAENIAQRYAGLIAARRTKLAVFESAALVTELANVVANYRQQCPAHRGNLKNLSAHLSRILVDTPIRLFAVTTVRAADPHLFRR